MLNCFFFQFFLVVFIFVSCLIFFANKKKQAKCACLFTAKRPKKKVAWGALGARIHSPGTPIRKKIKLKKPWSHHSRAILH